MNGVAVLVQLLGADGSRTRGLVALGSITAGVAPQGTALPIVAVESRGANDWNLPSPGGTRWVRERVQVTVSAATYERQKAILAAVKHDLADRLNPALTGLAAEVSGVTIHTDSAGPDFMNDSASIHIGTQDFMVKYTETR